MTMTDLTHELKRFSLLKGFSDAELDELQTILEPRTLRPGETLFLEHDAGDEAYFVRSGSLAISKALNGGTASHVVAVEHAGSVCGELAFLDGSPRSASATAVDTTAILALNKTRLAELPSALSVLNRLISNIALSSTDRLRRSTSQHVDSLEKQLAVIRTQYEFGQFFIYILACYAIGIIVNSLLQSYLKQVDVYSRVFSWSYLLVLLIPSLITIRVMKMPLSQIGVTLNNWKQALTEGALASVAFILLMWLMVLLTNLTFPPLSASLFVWGPSYFLHSCVQEFLARGIVQTSFQRFFLDERGLKSILLASLLFSLFHVHFGLIAILVTFVSSIVFGLVYLRHQNLIGVFLLHGIVGAGAFALGIL